MDEYQKTVLITGGSRGIGKAAAIAFARAGYRVGIGAFRSLPQAHALAEKLRGEGADAEVLAADLTDSVQAAAMIGQMQSRFGRVDVLVNNAGAAYTGLTQEMSDKDWYAVINLNLSAAFFTVRAVLPEMIARKSGCIINLSSVWGICGGSCEAAYSAAKAGVIGFTKALAQEVGPSGIRVNAVAPGVIDTDMNRELDEQSRGQLRKKIPLGKIGAPEQVARVIAFLASEGAAYITGQVIPVDGGFIL